MNDLNCTLCPKINITHENVTVLSVSDCIMRAAIKHNEKYYQLCGVERELNLAAPAEVTDANQFAGVVDAVVEEKPRKKSKKK